MLRLLCLGLIFLIPCAFADDFIPAKVLYAAVPYFPVVDFCNRNCTSGYQLLPGNIRYVTFSGQLNDGETQGNY